MTNGHQPRVPFGLINRRSLKRLARTHLWIFPDAHTRLSHNFGLLHAYLFAYYYRARLALREDSSQAAIQYRVSGYYTHNVMYRWLTVKRVR